MGIKLFFLAQVSATLAMAGITWFAQVVHTPCLAMSAETFFPATRPSTCV